MSTQLSAQKNKEIIIRLTQSFNDKKLEVIDELVGENYVDNGPFEGQLPGREGMKQAHRYFYAGFPDVHEDIDDIFAEDDRVVVRWTLTGTHTGRFVSMPIPPTGKRISIRGIDIYRLCDGKLVENWHELDALGVMIQLGLMPPPLYIIVVSTWRKLWGTLRGKQKYSLSHAAEN